MSRGISQKTKKMTVSAMLSALGVALLFISGLIETLDLSMAALASFFCIFAVIEIGGAYPWLIFAVTGALSFIIMPQNTGGWFYILFFGYYPILKEKIEKLKIPIAWAIKLVLVNVAMIVCVVIASFVFYGGNMISAIIGLFGAEDFGKFTVIIIYSLINVVFVIYDVALTRIISFYFIRLRHRFKFLTK